MIEMPNVFIYLFNTQTHKIHAETKQMDNGVL